MLPAPTWGQSLDPRRPDSAARVHLPLRSGLPQRRGRTEPPPRRRRSGLCPLHSPAACPRRPPPPAPSPSWHRGGPARGPCLTGSGRGPPRTHPWRRRRAAGYASRVGGAVGPPGEHDGGGEATGTGRGLSATAARPSAAGGGAGQVGGGRSRTRVAPPAGGRTSLPAPRPTPRRASAGNARPPTSTLPPQMSRV